MSTCQIEVLEFGQAMARSWVQTGAARAYKRDTECDCSCACPKCDEQATNEVAAFEKEHGPTPH